MIRDDPERLSSLDHVFRHIDTIAVHESRYYGTSSVELRHDAQVAGPEPLLHEHAVDLLPDTALIGIDDVLDELATRQHDLRQIAERIVRVRCHLPSGRVGLRPERTV